MQSVEEAGTPSRACDGALPSGNIANSAEGSLPFSCARIISITPGSSMQAMILTCPAQRSQVSISILNTRFSLCIQVIDWWRSAGVLSIQFSPLGWRRLPPLPRLAGHRLVIRVGRPYLLYPKHTIHDLDHGPSA